MSDVKYTIIGAGIVGLNVAYELVLSGESPDNIVIFEQHTLMGEQSSSRNSGVLHAGLYYPEESLKQCLCVEGNRLWRKIAKDLGISIKPCGKFLVASSVDELPALSDLFEFAEKKGVPVENRDYSEILPYAMVEGAFFSPTTAVVNVSEAIKLISNFLYMKNVSILLNQKVEALNKNGESFEYRVNKDKITSDYIINCAGHSGVELRRCLGLNDLDNYFVKGRYLKLNKDFYNDSLIYPIPPKGLKGLGVHTSFDFDGAIRFGPDTKESKIVDYQLEEDAVESMYENISKVFRGIEKSELQVDYAGVRSKIKFKNELYSDFWIKEPIKNYIECLGIESPGLTASPAIARYIRENFSQSARI